MSGQQKGEKKTKKAKSTALTWCPPTDHELFGTNKPLHGLAIRGHHLVRNPQIPDTPFQAYGDNGISLGRCFFHRKQMVPHGAHGEYVYGVSGDPHNGAFAVCVMSNNDYNDDAGETVMFPGPLPTPFTRKKNDDEDNGYYPDDYAPQTTALRKSCSAFKKADKNREDLKGSVRLFRQVSIATNGKVFRYDGLYNVVDIHEEYFLDAEKRMHPSFKLQRRGAQKMSLADIEKMTPKPEFIQEVKRKWKAIAKQIRGGKQPVGWHAMPAEEVKRRAVVRRKAKDAVDREVRKENAARGQDDGESADDGAGDAEEVDGNVGDGGWGLSEEEEESDDEEEEEDEDAESMA